jgi:hypothetical protein
VLYTHISNHSILHTAEAMLPGEPGRGADLASSLLPIRAGPASDWNLTIAWSDVEAVRRIYSEPRTRYADLKRVLISSGAAGSSVAFRLDMTKGGSRVWLCQLAGGIAVRTSHASSYR